MPIYNTNSFWNYVAEEPENVVDTIKEILTREYFNYDTGTSYKIEYFQELYKMNINGVNYSYLQFPAGLTSYVLKTCSILVERCPKNFKFIPKTEILKVADEVKAINPAFEVRDYQVSAVVTSVNRFASIVQSTVGSGKTSIMSLTAKLLKDKKIFITNGNNFILQQIYDRLSSFGETDVSWNCGGEPDYSKRIVIMNTSSSDSRLNRQDEAYLNFLKTVQVWQIDECAHFQSLTNFEPIFYMDHERLEHIIGYTATPFRNYDNPYGNEQDFTLIALLGEPAFVYEMKDTIADDNIAQPYGYFIRYKNYEPKLPNALKNNYYVQYKMNITYNKNRNRAGLEMIKFLDKNNIKTLAYVNNIKAGQNLMKTLKEEGVNSIFICGDETIYEWMYSLKGKLKLEKRNGNVETVKEALANGYNIVFGSSVMAEGVDISTFQASVLLNAGKSFISLIQLIGRSSRKKASNNISFAIDFRDIGGSPIFENQYNQRRKAMEDSGVVILDNVREFIDKIESIGHK